MNLSDEMWQAVCAAKLVSDREIIKICAEITEQHLAELEAERDELWVRARRRIAELEANSLKLRSELVVLRSRPDNVVTIDGKRWRVVREGDEAWFSEIMGGINCVLVPVEDPR